jgi:hypothetical protein
LGQPRSENTINDHSELRDNSGPTSSKPSLSTIASGPPAAAMQTMAPNQNGRLTWSD